MIFCFICSGEEIQLIAMAARVAARYGSRRLFSSGSGSGKILSEEEKAAENAYFKVTSTVLHNYAMDGQFF